MELEKLKKIIAEVLGVDPDEISEKTTFLEDLGADSLDVYQMVMAIEETYDILISREMAEQIRTVGEAVLLIKKTVSVTDSV
jgi:acyl carrier protein